MFARPLAQRLLLAFLFAATLPVLAAPVAVPPLLMSAKQSAALGVTLSVVQRGDVGSSSRLPAQVVVPNGQLRVLAAPVAALVEQVLVAPGDTVRKGQVLARLAGPDFLALQRDVRQAASQESLSRQQRQRDEALFAEGIIAEGRLQGSRAQYEQNAALFKERRAALQQAGAGEGGSAAVVAPLDGVVLEQMVVVGQRVDAAAPLFKLGKLTPLWLEIQAPAVLAGSLKVGAPVKVLGQAASSGLLLQIGRQVSAGQTVALRARIDKGTELLRPGQLVEAQIEVAASKPDGGKPLWRLPAAAVVRLHEGSYVFVAAPDGFRARPVRVAGQAGSEALLEGEFRDGEQVAVQGVSSLKAAVMGIGGEGN